MKSRRPFVCQRCRDIVRYPEDRVVLSLDFMQADSSRRFRRVKQADLCRDCMEVVVAEVEHGPLEMFRYRLIERTP